MTCHHTGKLSLTQLRQLYFKFKEDVFSTDRLGFAYNTEALEKILKDIFGTEARMSSVKFPRCVCGTWKILALILPEVGFPIIHYLLCRALFITAILQRTRQHPLQTLIPKIMRA